MKAIALAALLLTSATVAAAAGPVKKACSELPSAPVKKCVDQYGQGDRKFPLVCEAMPASAVTKAVGLGEMVAKPGFGEDRRGSATADPNTMNRSQCHYLTSQNQVMVKANIECAYRKDAMAGGLNAKWVRLRDSVTGSGSKFTASDVSGVGDGAVWWNRGFLDSVKGACHLEVAVTEGSAGVPWGIRDESERVRVASEISRMILERY